MSTHVAIDIAAEEATLVTGEIGSLGEIRIVDVQTVSISELRQRLEQLPLTNGSPIVLPEAEPQDVLAANDNAENELPAISTELIADTEKEEPAKQEPAKLIVESSAAVFAAKNLLVQRLALPFSDPAKIEKIVPLQIRDLLPFEVDDFVIDNLILGKTEENDYDLMTSLVPRRDVAEALETSRQLGFEPRVLTTKASAITTLSKLAEDQIQGTFAIIALNRHHYSLAIFINDVPKLLRDIPVLSGKQWNSVITDLKCSIARMEAECTINIESIYLVGSAKDARELQPLVGRPIKPLDLDELIQSDVGETINTNGLAWAVGLFVNEGLREKKRQQKIVNFRRGDYAYKPTLGNIVAALKDESFYIGAAIITGLLWIAFGIFSESADLSEINQFIEQKLVSTFPGEDISPGTESSYIESRTTELEDTLRELGSLTSLSPLDSLRELSTAIRPALDTEIESINIGASRITINGSVPNNPSVGALDTALREKQSRFCDVSVVPKDKVMGSSRVSFTADIKLCE